jgi:hypothetical protein
MNLESPREADDAVWRDRGNSLHTAYPGRVVRYYADRQTVDVQVGVMREVPGEEHEEDLYEQIEELVNVPIQWPRGGGFAITFPIKAGDYVLVICSTVNTLVWRDKGGVHRPPGVPGDEFGLNGCFALPGCFPDNRESTLQSVDTDNFVIRRESGGPAIKVTPGGAVSIDSSDITAGNGASAQSVALDPLVRTAIENAVKAAIIGHTHSVPASPTPATSGPGVATGEIKAASTAAKHLKAT